MSILFIKFYSSSTSSTSGSFEVKFSYLISCPYDFIFPVKFLSLYFGDGCIMRLSEVMKVLCCLLRKLLISITLFSGVSFVRETELAKCHNM
jgi:hypothetical protein